MTRILERSRADRRGTSIIEVVVAMMVLTISVLGMAGGAVVATRQLSIAELKTERTIVRQNTLERLRALPFDSVADGSDELGAFSLEWIVTEGGSGSKLITLTTSGPGIQTGTAAMAPQVRPDVSDIFHYRIIRP